MLNEARTGKAYSAAKAGVLCAAFVHAVSTLPYSAYRFLGTELTESDQAALTANLIVALPMLSLSSSYLKRTWENYRERGYSYVLPKKDLMSAVDDMVPSCFYTTRSKSVLATMTAVSAGAAASATLLAAKTFNLVAENSDRLPAQALAVGIALESLFLGLLAYPYAETSFRRLIAQGNMEEVPDFDSDDSKPAGPERNPPSL